MCWIIGFQSHVVHTGGYGGGHGGYYHGPQAVIGPHGKKLKLNTDNLLNTIVNFIVLTIKVTS